MKMNYCRVNMIVLVAHYRYAQNDTSLRSFTIEDGSAIII